MPEDIKLRKIRQYMQRATKDQFWTEMNAIHSQAYFKAINHMREALDCTTGISKKQAEAVMSKAKEICEQWDGMQQVEVASAIDQITRKREG